MKQVLITIAVLALVVGGLIYWRGTMSPKIEPGQVVIESIPSGATVQFQGHLKGETPLQLQDIVPGLYFLQLNKANYPAHSQMVRVEPGQTTRVKIDLEQLRHREMQGDEKTDVEMIYIPAGEFTMGLREDQIDSLLARDETFQREWFANQTPAKRVYVDAFYIDKYEVTNADFARFLNAVKPDTIDQLIKYDKTYTRIYPSGAEYVVRKGYENYPVVYVTFAGAQAFAAWAGKRLPTEAEWEKAARGDHIQLFPWGSTFEPDRANTSDVDDTYLGLAPVGTFPKGASPYGVEDLAGNLWEWCADAYLPDYLKRADTRNPHIPLEESPLRVLRGGSYLNNYHLAIVASRQGVPVDYRDFVVGFRCVKDAD
ncbi:MAG: PEGA domain-containing protein [Gemmatimonadetes bacterium]|nr:MAG: PEGA domain-containing protein [Gemmatimonadota bacterium]